MIKIKTVLGIICLCTVLFNTPIEATSPDDSCQRLVLTLLTPNIKALLEEYYKDKLTYPPIFAPYLRGNTFEFKTFDSHMDVLLL